MEPNFTALKYNCRLFDKGPGISLKLRQRSELIFLKTLEPIFNMFFFRGGFRGGRGGGPGGFRGGRGGPGGGRGGGAGWPSGGGGGGPGGYGEIQEHFSVPSNKVISFF